MVVKIKENLGFLKSIAKANLPKRQRMLGIASPSQLRALQEIAVNVSKKVVPLSPCQNRNLLKGRYKKSIIAAASKKGSLENKRKIFIQRGGFLQYIIPAALMYLQKYI